MGLMNKTEYTQACLFRVREALQTAEAWWSKDSNLDREKIIRTGDMLEDTIDELNYFREKLMPPTNNHGHSHEHSTESELRHAGFYLH